jgi:hypothetical protein
MKCPECDTEQPDDTAVCKGCGLNFSMWVAHTGESLKTVAVPSEEKAGDSAAEPVSHKVEAKSDREEILPSPQDQPTPPKAKGFKWSPVYGGGFILLIVVVLGLIYLIQQPSKHVPTADNIIPTPTVNATPGSTLTPAPSVTAVSALAAGTPVNGKAVNTPMPKPTSTPTPSPTAEEPTATFTETPIPPAEALAASEPTPNPGTATEAPTPVTTAAEAVASPVAPAPSPAPGSKDPLDSSEGVTLSIPAAVPSPKP